MDTKKIGVVGYMVIHSSIKSAIQKSFTDEEAGILWNPDHAQILNQVEVVVPVADWCREYGMTSSSNFLNV